MNIHFYLNTEEETEIVTFYDLESNPFKIGDEVNLSVDEFYPIDYNKHKKEFVQELIEDNNQLQAMFNRKKIKIMSEGKYASFNTAQEAKLTIEYYCDLVE